MIVGTHQSIPEGSSWPDFLDGPRRLLSNPAIPQPLTAEQFVDFLSEKTLAERSALQHLHVRAYPFPLSPEENERGYPITYSFESLLPLFPGLNLAKFEVEDPCHWPYAIEDGWGDNATYNTIGYFIKEIKGWKELVFRSPSDTWMKPVTFEQVFDGKPNQKEVKGT